MYTVIECLRLMTLGSRASTALELRCPWAKTIMVLRTRDGEAPPLSQFSGGILRETRCMNPWGLGGHTSSGMQLEERTLKESTHHVKLARHCLRVFSPHACSAPNNRAVRDETRNRVLQRPASLTNSSSNSSNNNTTSMAI